MSKHTLLFHLALALAFAPVLHSAPPAERGPLIERGKNDDAWRPLFSALAAKGPAFCVFTEHRRFAARKQPVSLAGEMRLIPGRGLSLLYTAPENTLSVIDTNGIRLRDARGRVREIKAGSRDAGLTAALLPVMRFDEEELFKNFTLHAARDGDDWRLDFVPLDEKLAAALGSIAVSGAGADIKRLAFNVSPKVSVEVLLGEIRGGVVFSEEDIKKYFR